MVTSSSSKKPVGTPEANAAVRRDRIDFVHRRLKQVLQRNEVFGRAAVGNVVDLGLRAVDNLGDIGALRAGIAVLNDTRTGVHQPAQQRLLGHDGGVVARVGRGRHRGNQRVQVGRAADTPEQPSAVKLRGHRDGVRGLTAAVEVEDRFVDALVVGAVEVAGPESLEDIGDGVLAQQHSAEDSLFCGLVLRRLPTEVFGRRWNVVDTGMATVVDDSHDGPPPLSARTCVR